MNPYPINKTVYFLIP